MLYEFRSGDREELRSEAWQWRIWVNIFATQDRRKVINRAFLSCVSSLPFSSPYCIASFDLGLVKMASGQVVPPLDLGQWEEEIPHAPDLPKAHSEWY